MVFRYAVILALFAVSNALARPNRRGAKRKGDETQVAMLQPLRKAADARGTLSAATREKDEAFSTTILGMYLRQVKDPTTEDAADGLARFAERGERLYRTALIAGCIQTLDGKRQAIVDSWPADVNDEAAREDWGWAPEYDLPCALDDYLVPGIRERIEAGR